MNEELTNEVLEAIKNCVDRKCASCPAKGVCVSGVHIALATALLEERAKPKAWDGAPDDATQAQIEWYDENDDFTGEITYTREIPKTRARQIAEQEGRGLVEKYGWNAATKELVTNVMESALNKYAEELEEKK